MSGEEVSALLSWRSTGEHGRARGGAGQRRDRAVPTFRGEARWDEKQSPRRLRGDSGHDFNPWQLGPLCFKLGCICCTDCCIWRGHGEKEQAADQAATQRLLLTTADLHAWAGQLRGRSGLLSHNALDGDEDRGRAERDQTLEHAVNERACTRITSHGSHVSGPALAQRRRRRAERTGVDEGQPAEAVAQPAGSRVQLRNVATREHTRAPPGPARGARRAHQELEQPDAGGHVAQEQRHC